MKNYTTLLLALAIALPAAAQDTHKTSAYGYFGAGTAYGKNFGQYLNVGGGAEHLLHKGMTVGADAGYLGYRHNFTQEGFGLVSPSVGYNFLRSTKVVPFVSAGYSLAFRNGTASMFHYGGGATYWFKPRVGLRMEVRDYRFAEYAADHATVVRIGFSFR